MFNKTLKFLSISLFISLFIVFLLYRFSSKNTDHRNGFNRKFHAVEIVDYKEMNMKYVDYYIAGFTSNQIYLGNYHSPIYILKTNYNLSDTLSLYLTMKDTTRYFFKSARLTVDSPYIYVNEGITPFLSYGRLNDLTLTKHMDPKSFFLTSLPISPSSIILKGVLGDPQETCIIKQINSPPYITNAPWVLEKQIDGIFCTDGTLDYDRKTSQLVYVYRYRNEFICMDTSLTVTFKANTIDTTSVAKIKVATIESEGKITLSSPPLKVNKRICVSNGKLFVHSELLADNESKDDFKRNAAIDTYSLRDGSYLFSFYIPLPNGKMLKDFQIVDSSIIAIYDNLLRVYKMKILNKS